MAQLSKRDILKSIRGARRSHVKWVDHAKALVNGLKITKEQIPLEVTNCDFGQWFYGDKQMLLFIFREEAIEKLELKHKELHNTYMKIFKIYFSTSRLSLWDKILKRKKRISATQEHIAFKYLAELEAISGTLISYLNSIEKKVSSIDENKFDKYY